MNILKKAGSVLIMEINIPKINKQHLINKAELEEMLQVKDTIKLDDKEKGNNIRPYLNVSMCDNLIYQNVLLKTCIDTLAEDVIYNDIHIINPNQPNDELDDIKNFWLNNQDEMEKTITDYYSYGFGACEVILDVDTKLPVELFEIQADTLYIKKKTDYDENGEKKEYYYAVQQVNGVDTVYMKLVHHEKLTGYDYPITDQDLHYVLWFGGGRKSDFYDYPCWISAFNHVSASVSLDMLDAQKLADGNLISGILTIIRPPAPITVNNEGQITNDPVEDTLEEKMEAKGSGVFTLELTTLNPDIPLDVKYIQISESNYTYLNELSEKSDKKILGVFKIPKARLLIDDTTESMNSNKTNTLYKIYTNELSNKQRVVENQMKLFNKFFWGITTNCNIITPIFNDDKDIEVQNVLNLFNNGIITLSQAIKKIFTIYPEYEDYIDIDFNNPLYHDRYYNGQPLGFTEPTKEEEVITGVGELIDYLQIN